MIKKIKNLGKLKKNNNKKNPTIKKQIKSIKILKKSTGSVQFYKPKTEKIKPNPNKKKLNQTGKNRVKNEKPSQTGLNRFLS
jgi:hypothetical protein